MHYEEMLSWLLFYTSLLDVVKTPAQAVIDPGGVVQSQVVETTDGAIRLVLNASQSQQTQASRFLSDFFGSGVQHIAFATDDVFATLDRLKANGVALLPIPENYYDDLEARTDLEPRADRAAAPAQRALRPHRRRGILPGLHDDTGRRLLLRDRRAAEIPGFGAVNAPIRLAAQTRLARP